MRIDGNGWLLVGMSLIIIISFLLLKLGVVAYILEEVQNGIGYENVIGYKARDIAALLEGASDDQSDFSVRLDLYAMSWKSFCNYPLFGTNNFHETGGHAHWLDILGKFGFVGFLVEFLVFVIAFRNVYQILPRYLAYYYSIALVYYVVICSVKAAAFNVQSPVFFLMFSAMLLLKKDDFYIASNNIRYIYRLPPRIQYQ